MVEAVGGTSGTTGGNATAPADQAGAIQREADQLVGAAARTLGNTAYIDTDDLARAVAARNDDALTQAVLGRLDPVEQGGFLRALDRAGGQDPFTQAFGADADFLRNYGDMRAANTIGADKYFHCKANFEAAQRGTFGAIEATLVSNARETVDQWIKGDPASASAADQAANMHGRAEAQRDATQMGREACHVYRPNGLDARY